MNSSIIQPAGAPAAGAASVAAYPAAKLDSPAQNSFLTRRSSQPEQIAQPPRLRPAHRNLRLFPVVHADLVAALEPRNHFLDPVDVHQKRAVRPPEQVGV